MHYRCVLGLIAILPALHGEHPRPFVLAGRDESVSFPVEYEGADPKRMTPNLIEKRLPVEIPNACDVAGHGQELSVRAEGQSRDLSLMLDRKSTRLNSS